MNGVRRWVAVSFVLLVGVPVAAAPVRAVHADGACAASTSAADLSAFFGSGASGLVGGDYPHAYPLPDGRVLWLFQDGFLGAPDTPTLGEAGFTHNSALVQTGLCFEPRWGGGPIGAPASFLGGTMEQDMFHWWWPLDGAIGADGNLHVFAAEFVNPAGTGAAAGAEPIAVWRAVIRPSDLAIIDFAPAPDSGDLPLYGFSVVSDDDWSYLYGNCYRQFMGPAFVGWFDTSCTTHMYVARVPRGHFEAVPTYWNGIDWVAERAAAVIVHADGTLANPLQVTRIGADDFVAVSHLDDWFGTAVSVYSAHDPTGPFARYALVPVDTKCGAACTTYSAELLPWLAADGSFEVATSNFTWDFALAVAAPWLYRPSVITVPSPDTAPDPHEYTIEADGTVALKLEGRNGVGPGAAAVAFTLVATGAVANGFVTAWACGSSRPVASSLNLAPNSTVGNTVIAPIGLDGRVCLWSSARTYLIVDVQGWMTSQSDHHSIAPARLLDTRAGHPTADGAMAGIGMLLPGAVLAVPVAGRAGVAAWSREVSLNITVAGATSPGYVTAWQCGESPATSSVNVVVGQAASNLAIVGLSAVGTVCLKSSVPTNVIVDAQGWWSGAGEVVTVGPSRLLDTRPAATTVDGTGLPGRQLTGGEVFPLPVAGRAGVGDGEAVVLGVVATRADRSGYLTVWPCDEPQPVTSNVNFQAAAARATLAITALAGDGSVCVSVGGATRADVVIDVMGWFPAADGGYMPLVPSRALDTRER